MFCFTMGRAHRRQLRPHLHRRLGAVYPRPTRPGQTLPQKLAATEGPKERGNIDADSLNLILMGPISGQTPPSRTTRPV